MRSVLLELDQVLRNGRAVCFTALVETRGSTPQKAGAAMLVFPDGSQVGTLGGGCVEAEVKRRALEVLARGETELLTFQLDRDYGWDDGLICGGRMKMLVDPLRPDDQLAVRYYQRLTEWLLAGRGITEVVVLDDNPSGDHLADRWLIEDTARVIDSRRDRPPSAAMMDRLVRLLRPLSTRPRPYVVEGLSFLPHLPRCRLVVVGAGHVGQKVAQLACEADFDVWVVDDRHEYCNSERFPGAKRLIVAPIENALAGLEVDSDTYCLIVTRGHNHDEEALFHLAETSARYVGLIGSRRKIKLIFRDLLKQGIAADSLRRVHAPLGFDIGSQTVPEIAISILAELVAHRNLGKIPEAMHKPCLLDELDQAPD